MADTWLDACALSNTFVDPIDHLLTDPAAESKFGFSMRTSYERAQHHLLLTGCTVYFTPGWCCKCNPPAAVLSAAELTASCAAHHKQLHRHGIVQSQIALSYCKFR